MEHLPDAEPDRRLALQGAPGPVGGRDDLIELALGGFQERLALLGASYGHQRILAHDEVLTGIIGALDLGEIALVEERELDLPRLDERPDGRGAQRRDPIQTLDRFDLIADPGFGDHPPISHQHHTRELETMAQLLDLGAERLGIGSIPVKHFHGHRTSRSVA